VRKSEVEIGAVQSVPECCITAQNSNALVVFMGDVSIRWAKLLRPGFRHCFAVVGRNEHWVIFDPMSNFTNLGVFSGPSVDDVAEWYRQFGFTVVRTAVRREQSPAAEWRPFTCVEAVKRVLGIRAPWVITPWQLYRHIVHTKSKKALTLGNKKEYNPFNERNTCVRFHPRCTFVTSDHQLSSGSIHGHSFDSGHR